MKQNWRRIMTTFGFVGCLAMVAPSCVVRARVRPAVVVVDEAPPEPTYETVRPRAGYVWVRGHWQMRNNRWKWKRGHWVRARSGHVWQAGHWERRGGRHHWVAGRWVAGSAPAAPGPRVRDHRAQPAPAAYPTTPPPAPRYTRPAPRNGYVWVRGRYDWKGRWVWTAGHWQRAKAQHTWTPGHWEKRGNRYVWVKGRWVKGAAGPAVRDHRKKAPPPPPARKNERVPATRGGR